MGWFVIAVIFGFYSYWRWNRVDPSNTPGQLRIVLQTLAILVGAFFIWAVLIEEKHSLSAIVAALGQGEVARFILGGALGLGLAHVVIQVPPNTNVYLWVALGATVLAIVSPRLDMWLSELTEFKSALVEFV